MATQEHSGDLTITADDGKRFTITFARGKIVAAISPLAADSAVRVAMTSHLVTSTQVQAIAKRIGVESHRDELDVLAEMAKLAPDKLDRLRRKLLVQRAARTFAIDQGTYSFELARAPMRAAVTVDVGAAIYLGARMYLAEQRLTDDVRHLGARFVLAGDTIDLDSYGFTDAERPILDSLRVGAGLPELDAKHREIEPRTAQAMIYALVASGACHASGPREIRQPERAPTKRFDRDELQVLVRESVAGSNERTHDRLRTRSAGRDVRATRPDLQQPPLPRANTDLHVPVEPTRARTVTFEAPTTMRKAPALPRTVTPRRSALEVRETLEWGRRLMERGADHFAFFGLSADASLDSIRSAYVALASQLHPEKLPVPLTAEERAEAQQLFAHVSALFAIVGDPVQRAAYASSLTSRARTGEISGPGRVVDRLSASPFGDAARLGKAEACESPAERLARAAEAHTRGIAALKRDDVVAAIGELSRAVELAPADVDHHAALAWARFCASTDKQAIAPDTRKSLEKAIAKSPKPVVARFYLGRVERMLGRVPDALRHFHEVIAIEPNHAEAAAELRMLEPRQLRRR